MPALLPVTTPENVFTNALPLLLPHVPPASLFVSVVIAPSHTALEPAIAAGSALTVATALTIQPEGSV